MALLILLGRAGDCLNVLPAAYALSRKIGRVNWLVGKDYQGTLEGCSYVNAVRWEGGQDSLPEALRTYGNAGPICFQAWLNPDSRRLTDSYALEQWRLGGMLSEFGSWPLIMDRQNEARANMLRDRVLSNYRRDRPLIIACVDGVSSPFVKGPTLLAMLRGLDADVVDLRDVRAERVPDLVALFNAADLLVPIDTMPLHLARASSVPTFCLLNDDWNGWRASVPPPQCVAKWTYSEANADLEPIVAAAAAFISRSAVVTCNLFDTTSDRGKAARATWPDGWLAPKPKRSAKDIGDARPLPYLRDILAAGLEAGDGIGNADVVIWTNDDCGFTPGALDAIKAHVSRWDFGCVRRDPQHMGREAFFFRASWLRDNLAKMPDVIMGTCVFDLTLAKWLRGLRGIKTTMENLALDFPPVDLPAGLVSHVEHESSWLAHQDAPSAEWNRKLFEGLG
jgi:hypothetical protein